MSSSRSYKVGSLVFKIELEEPWKFMNYTPAVMERILCGREGKVLPILPVRAGDEVPSRSYVCTKDELPKDMDSFTLDFSQYEPFYTEESGNEIFDLKVGGEVPEWLSNFKADPDTELIYDVDNESPFIFLYRNGNRLIYDFQLEKGKTLSTLVTVDGSKFSNLYPSEGTVGRGVVFSLGMALMMLYSVHSADKKALMIHASTVRHNGNAKLFLGTSGTGKSTHARLWLENIEGSELLNDDNPVLRIEDGDLYVYGTPWSGKTPCYRNVRAKVGAIVSLNQAPVNEISRKKGIAAYADILSSASALRWDRAVMDGITSTSSEIAMTVPCFSLRCLPNSAAADLCRSAVETA